MNYYEARQSQKTGRWDYTSANRRTGIHPVGYCATQVACPCWIQRMSAQRDCIQCDGLGFIENPDYCGSHDTPEGARECFARYLLDGWREESYRDWTGCVICDTPTKQGLTTRPPLGHGFPLCDEHRIFEHLKQLTPSGAGQIIASY